MTHPTQGFGDVRLRAPAAAAIARCIRWCSLALVLTASSVRDQGSRSVHEDADTTAGARASRRPLPRSHPDSPPRRARWHDDTEHRRPWDSTRSANGPKAEGSRALTAGQDSHPYPARGGISFGCRPECTHRLVAVATVGPRTTDQSMNSSTGWPNNAFPLTVAKLFEKKM